MMTRQKTLWFTLLLIGLYTSFLNASEITRWVITSPDSICWRVNGVHNDHIEMSGLKVSTVLRYGVNEAGEWVIDRNMVLPTFRTIPNDTHGSLQHHFNGDWAHLCLVNGQPLVGEKVETVSLNGIMTVKSVYATRGISLTRTLFPSTSVRNMSWRIRQITHRQFSSHRPLFLIILMRQKEWKAVIH